MEATDFERKPKEPKKETQKGILSLYAVNEVNGGFEVILPGGWDSDGNIVATTAKRFNNKEEAEQAAEQARVSVTKKFELRSLRKSFTENFRSITETPDGKFRVTLPLTELLGTGYFVGSFRDFETWQQAKEYFLQQKERVTHKPLLEIQINSNEKIAFSDLDYFNPSVTPSEQVHEIPPSIQKYLFGKEKLAGTDPNASTYQETIKEKNWERKLYSFISSYLEKDGAEIIKQLKIKSLDSLTPKQAIELATRIVIDLTKYKQSDTIEQRGETAKDEKTKADQSSVLEILTEGQLRRNDPDWEGNGICRNFASSVKAVFEALKTNQTQFSQLSNTYCTYEGAGSQTYAPKTSRIKASQFKKHPSRNDTKIEQSTGHAWNTFITISREGDANAVIVDATWGKIDLETKKIRGLDYTLTRMEPIVQAIGQELREDTPNKEEQLKHLLSFYMLAMEKPGDTGGHSSPEEQKLFYARRALALMALHGVPQNLPTQLVEAIEQAYLKIADDITHSEVETIYKISQNNPQSHCRNILKNYLEDTVLSDYHIRNIIFKDDNLQRAVFEELKLDDNFDKLLKTNMELRIRMREVLPGLFIDFSPETKPEDAKELRYILSRSQMLRHYEHISTKKIFEIAREKLKTTNPQQYEERFASLDDYQLIKQFDRIYRELEAIKKTSLNSILKK